MTDAFLQRPLRLWLKLPPRYRGAVFLAIPATFLLFTLVTWVWSRDSSLAIQRQVDDTEAIMAEGNDILIALLNAETAVRGYRLTQDEQFLEPYILAERELPASLNRLKSLLSRNPQHYQRVAKEVEEMEALAEQRMELIQQAATRIRNGELGVIPSPSNGLLFQGKTVMDEFRESLDRFQSAERNLLDSYQAQLNRLQDTISALLWTTMLISLLGCAAALYLFSQLDWKLQTQELRLQESRLLVETISRNAIDGIITLDRHGRIETCNQAAARMFEYEPEDIIGKDLGVLLAEVAVQQPDGTSQVNFLRDYQEQIGRPWETLGYRRAGESFPIEVSVSETELEGRLIAIIRDISERKRAAEKLESHVGELARLNLVLANTNARLEGRNQELDQFAYVASHDLKAPLRAISNLSEWIEEDLADQLPPENRHQMHLLRGRVHRMEALINGLLEYSRVGRMETPTETVNVGDLLEDVIDSIDPPAEFTIQVQPGMPTLVTKRVPLRQVFANLITNAIKHHPRTNGQIEISVAELDRFYEFAVKDDGQGIDPRYHQKIFTIFQTLEARDTAENTGIGLSVVKKIVETEGGTIHVESEMGQGATFRFTWLKRPARSQQA